MRLFLDYLKHEQDEGIKEREVGNSSNGGAAGGTGEPNPWAVSDAFATTTAVESHDNSVDDDDRELLEAVLHGIGPITTVSQLAEAADQLALLTKNPGSQSSPVDPFDPESLRVSITRPPQTEQEIVADCKSQAADALGTMLRRLGHKPSDGNYGKIRARAQRDVNSAFGVNSTEVITTKEQARAYLKHVRGWVAER
jgi:hypothetical protein